MATATKSKRSKSYDPLNINGYRIAEYDWVTAPLLERIQAHNAEVDALLQTYEQVDQVRDGLISHPLEDLAPQRLLEARNQRYEMAAKAVSHEAAVARSQAQLCGEIFEQGQEERKAAQQQQQKVLEEMVKKIKKAGLVDGQEGDELFNRKVEAQARTMLKFRECAEYTQQVTSRNREVEKAIRQATDKLEYLQGLWENMVVAVTRLAILDN